MGALVSRFYAVAEARPEACAIRCDGESLTYAELARRAARLAYALAAQGVAPRDSIAVMARNAVDFVTLMLAAADCGAMLAPLSPGLPAEAALRAFAAADVRHVCAEAAALARLDAHGFDRSQFGLVCAFDELGALLTAAPEDAGPLRRGADDAPYLLGMTSGSTGAPKAITLTQRAKLERARAAIALYGVVAQDRVLAATPLYHSLAERLAFTALLSGARLVLMSQFTPASWLACVEREEASFTIAVSTQLSAIARHLRAAPEAERAKCASLRCVVSSSAPLPAEDKELVLSVLPGELHECYGASEIAIASSLDLRSPDIARASVGLAAPGVAIRILDEAGALLPAGEVGEIACKTPMAFAGYYNRPDLTDAAMRDGYFKTGDLGRMDEMGALYYLGRKKDVIITGGVKVYPTDIEAVAAATPGVAECAAFAWPDRDLGEVVALAVVPSAPGAVSARALRRSCLDALADFQHPRRIFFLDALPRNAMGKLMRSQLPERVQDAPAPTP